MGLKIDLNLNFINKWFFNVRRDVRFDLYTLKNPNEPQHLVIYDINSIIDSNFNCDVPTRILIHGFQSEGGLRNVFTEGKLVKKS